MFFSGSPFLNHISFFINDLKFRTLDFFSIRNIRLGNRYFCMVVLHFYFLDFSSLFHNKGHILCTHIALFCRSLLFVKGIGSCREILNQVFFSRNPFLDHISLFIKDLKFCTFNLFSGCNICFGNRNLRMVVLHFYFLDFPGLFHNKSNILCTHITFFCRSLLFMEYILSRFQSIHGMWFFS